MVIETKKENLCINQNVAQKEVTVEIEGDIIIPDVKPDILNAVSANGNVCIYKKDIFDGKIRFDGSIDINVMYMPDGETNSVRGLNTNLDFTEIVDVEGIKDGMKSVEDISIKSIECRVLNGRKINLRAMLQIKIKVYINDNISLIQKIENSENIQTLNKTIEVSSLVGEGGNKIYAKDTIHIDEIDNLAEILQTDLDIINKEIKVSYNKVLVKSDLNVKIIYLTEDGRVNSVNQLIPVMGFVDIPNVTDDNMCDTKYQIRNIIVKPNSVEEHSIYIEVQIEMFCNVYQMKEINVIEDLYSPKKNIIFDTKTISTISEKKEISDICKIEEQIQIPEIGNNRIYNVNVIPRILSENIINNKIIYEGEIELDFLYESDNIIKLDAKKMNINFNFTMDANGMKAQDKLDTSIEVIQNDFIVRGDGNIECKISMQIKCNITKQVQINVIDEINSDDNVITSDYSMVIYFVKSGDTLWSIAKKLRSTVKDIVKVNEIEENNIYPGMQLFVPKFNEKN